MSNNYLRVGKIYHLTSATNVTIPGASFIHGINNNDTGKVIVIIDDVEIHIAQEGTVSFSIPIAFSSLKVKNAGETAAIFYS
jgi:hypothetical protein